MAFGDGVVHSKGQPGMGNHGNGNGRREEFPQKIQSAIQALLEASDYACQTTGDPWEFAVEIRQLRGLGLTSNDLRYLVRKSLVEHAREMTIVGQDGRKFQQTGDLTFTKRTCFVLTSTGVAAAREALETKSGSNGSALAASTALDAPTPTPGVVAPTWDPEKRELRIDGRVVKRFKWHAENQERVLAAFDEEGWPFRIDDPLPPHPEQDSKRRLSDTIKCLNRKQTSELLRFRGDGTGEGVVWEFVGRNE